MIKIAKYSDLDNATKSTLEHIIESEFGNIPIVKETQWDNPDWTIIYYIDSKIVTFYNMIERIISINDRKVKISGINNLITLKASRGNGYASKILKETENLIFNDIGAELGVLLCADELVPFYQRLDWYKINCPVYFDQSSGEKLWNANTMLLAKNEKIFPQLVRLNGLPW